MLFASKTSISECERRVDIQYDDGARAICRSRGWPDFRINCSKRFSELWGKVKQILLLVFPTMYVVEQGFNQLLHMRNKYRNRLDMSKTP